jgi:hypothetical protein
MKPGWNPTRRNRNAGTGAHGHGNDNKLRIPEPWIESRRFYERIGPHRQVLKTVGASAVRFVVEEPRLGWFHPCTPDEICTVLGSCPEEHVSLAPLIVLRQPTRKQRILSQVWGRAVFLFEYDDYAGCAIVLEAQDSQPYLWRRSRTPDHERELDRLRRDGHTVARQGRDVLIEPNAAAIRTTVLYRTLLHELGHHVDYARSTSEEWDARTPLEREDYAHSYAQAARDRLQKNGITLPTIRGASHQAEDDLPQEWFALRKDA